ncbi:MAG: membrane protein insertase YidC [Nitrospirae bacterium]|nr:MAG: membrane protein insertase YidC [Nitrospirota bacterium]
MEKRIILFLVLSMAVIVLYPYLLEKMGIAKRPVPASSAPAAKKKDADKAAPAPALPPPAAQAPSLPKASVMLPPPALTGEHEQEVTVETDLARVVLSNRGGVIKRWELKRYLNTDPKQPKPIQLVPADEKGVALIPPLTVEVLDAKLQERLARGLYAVSGKDLNLNEGRPAGEIGFSYTDPETGAQVTKRLTFHHGSYLVDLTVETSGVSSSTTLSLGTNFGIHQWEEGFVGFIGPATHIGGKLDKATPEKEDLRAGQVKWAAMQDKYFLAAAIPADAVLHIGVVRKEGERLVSVGLRTPAAPGTVASRYRLFVGPKEYDTLEALKIELEETIDFGWFIYGSWSFVRAVAKPLFYAIRHLHDLTHNYGVAIIIVTIGIKLLLAPLAYKSYKSMKDMAAIQPELMALQKKYADDRDRLNKELIKLYKDKKVNPVGGCLPMFFQIPIFVALFNILYMTIELRQAPFLLWVKDLSVQDPYYVLPILMGVTMFIQQKIQPTTMDPKQAQIMLLLPVFLTFLFVTFPAGLVLYWLTNNVLTIAQQVVTDRYLLPKAPAPATAPAAK